MAGRKKTYNYYLERQKQAERQGDVETNLIFGMAEKLEANYVDEKYKQVENKYGDVETNLLFGMAEKLKANYVDEKYKQVENKYGVEFAQPVERRTAPTTNPPRPRALNLAYMKETETLLIQFRDASYICEYPNVPAEVWQDLKTTDSTGKYLRYSGLDGVAYNKINKSQFPEEIKVLFD